MTVLSPDPAAVKKAAELLRARSGAVILVPTETVYGLICAYDDEAARQKIYAMKHRPENKHFTAFVPEISFVSLYAPAIYYVPLRLAWRFMPGPLTLIVPADHGTTFGFRIPDHPFMKTLLDEVRMTLASTSANLSGQPDALTVDDALKSLDGEPDLVIDGGAIPAGSKPSTIVQTMPDYVDWKILRQGPITEEQIREAVKDLIF